MNKLMIVLENLLLLIVVVAIYVDLMDWAILLLVWYLVMRTERMPTAHILIKHRTEGDDQ